MTEKPLCILAIFAHPDDEIGAGSTLARYSDAGVRVVLACATRGEAATIFCEACATRETLGQVRTEELACACDHLGIRELVWLDWPDGGISHLPRDRAVEQVVGLIRRVQPDIVITHPQNGLYPHPDHLAVYEIVTEAFSAAADGTRYPGTGAPWAAPRLFTRAMPQSIFERAPGLAQFRVELNGRLLPFIGTPDDEIDVVMRVEPWVPRRMAAWDCHRSQHNPNGFSSTMPDGLRREMAANEHFLLVAANVPMPDGVSDDLLAGLSAEGARRAERPRQGAAGSRREPAQAATSPSSSPGGSEEPAGAGVSEDDAPDRLRAELACHRAIAELCQSYLSAFPEQKFTVVLRRLSEGQQETIYRLARALRLAGHPAGDVAADATVRAQGVALARPEQQLSYLAGVMGQVAERMQEMAREDDEERRVLWRDLAALARVQADLLSGVDGRPAMSRQAGGEAAAERPEVAGPSRPRRSRRPRRSI